MKFTLAQQSIIIAWIQADPVFSAFDPNNYDKAFEIAKALNTIKTPDVWLWNSRGNVDDVFDAINWANFTPNWTVANNETAVQLQAKIAWNGIINIQQMNLQNMLIRMETINATKQNIRQGLADSLSGLPTGAISGNAPTSRNAGSVAVMNALRRKATVLEDLLKGVVATTSTVSAFLPEFEGEINGNDIVQMRAV